MVELIAKTFYDALAKNKLMGLKCAKCEHYSFPPKGTCNGCGTAELKWVELSGKGKLQLYNIVNYPGGEFQKVAPYAYGLVMLKEGIPYFTMIEGVDIEDPWKGNLDLPMDVVAKVKKIGSKRVVVFKPER